MTMGIVEAEFVSMPSSEALISTKTVPNTISGALIFGRYFVRIETGPLGFLTEFYLFSSVLPASSITSSNIPLLPLKNVYLFTIPGYISALFGRIGTFANGKSAMK
jgi:hypothetical protein